MADDQIGVKEGEEQPVESPTTEEPTEEAEEQVEESTEESISDEAETGQGKGANQRIRELNQRAKAAEERAKSLEERVTELTGSDESRGFENYNPQQPNRPIVQPGEELTAEELNRRIEEREQRLLQLAEARGELRNRQSQAITRHQAESGEVMKAYSQLDPNSDDFDPELSEAVTEAVEAQLKANPYSASVKKIVEKQMKPYLRAVANEVDKERENIAKQVSQSALRPTSVRKSEKTAKDKTLAELEAELGIVNS